MDFTDPEKRKLDQEERMNIIKAKESELVGKRRRILEKLSPEDQEELAQIDLEWDNLKDLRRRMKEDR